MSFDYEALKLEVDELLAEFGQDCELRRMQSPVTIDPVAGTVSGTGSPLSFPTVGVVVDYNEKMVDGEVIKQGDRLVYIQASERPQIGDVFVEANATRWAVINYSAVDPAGVPVLFSLQVRQ